MCLVDIVSWFLSSLSGVRKVSPNIIVWYIESNHPIFERRKIKTSETEVIYFVTGKTRIYSQDSWLGSEARWYMAFSAYVRP